jgi:hypothetical protein
MKFYSAQDMATYDLSLKTEVRGNIRGTSNIKTPKDH